MKTPGKWLQQLFFNVDFTDAVDEAFRDYSRISSSEQPAPAKTLCQVEEHQLVCDSELAKKKVQAEPFQSFFQQIMPAEHL